MKHLREKLFPEQLQRRKTIGLVGEDAQQDPSSVNYDVIFVDKNEEEKEAE